MTAVIHTHLPDKDLLPGKHYADTAYQSATNLVTSSRQGIDLIGPAPVDTNWQARRQTGFDIASFDIDWDAQVVICPAGKRSCTWRESTGKTRSAIRVSFARRDCAACPHRADCVQRTDKPPRKRPDRPRRHSSRSQSIAPWPPHASGSRPLSSSRITAAAPGSRAPSRKPCVPVTPATAVTSAWPKPTSSKSPPPSP